MGSVCSTDNHAVVQHAYVQEQEPLKATAITTTTQISYETEKKAPSLSPTTVANTKPQDESPSLPPPAYNPALALPPQGNNNNTYNNQPSLDCPPAAAPPLYVSSWGSPAPAAGHSGCVLATPVVTPSPPTTAVYQCNGCGVCPIRGKRYGIPSIASDGDLDLCESCAREWSNNNDGSIDAVLCFAPPPSPYPPNPYNI